MELQFNLGPARKHLICVIFNDAVSSSGFVMLNAKVTNERCSGQNMDVSDHNIL